MESSGQPEKTTKGARSHGDAVRARRPDLFSPMPPDHPLATPKNEAVVVFISPPKKRSDK
jgi:hypothetical protein